MKTFKYKLSHTSIHYTILTSGNFGKERAITIKNEVTHKMAILSRKDYLELMEEFGFEE